VTPARHPAPFVAAQDGVRVRIRLVPKASANKIAAIETDADGSGLIKVMVTAVPEQGKANAALIKLLAGEWRLAKSTILVIRGATDRDKTLLVAQETDTLMQQLHQWLEKF